MKKSKIIAFFAIAAMFVATSASAFVFNTNLGFGMRNNDVRELQLRLNAEVGTSLPGTTYFGPLTRTTVQSYQTMKGITPVSGYVGPLTRAALNGSAPSTGGLPAGCTSTSGFSTTTGTPCNMGGTVNLPAGCTSTMGFSPTTGVKCDSGSTTTPQTGAVTAMLAMTNPATTTLVAGQATADLAHFTFTGSGPVTNVTLQRIGVSADTTLSNVYLFDGANRLTDAASVTNNGMITFTSGSGLFTVNGSKTISVRSDILTGTSGQTVGVRLVSFAVGGTTVTANISANLHATATATLATVSAGTVTPSNATLNPGPGVTVWQSTLNISQRDVMMKRFAVRQVGSASASSFANFKLFVNGVQVATATGIDSMGYVTFDMMSNPVTLASGSRLVRIDADILSGASRTVHFSVRQAADVDFVDSSYGVNITPTSTPWTASQDSDIGGSTGGSMTIEKDTSSPTQPVTIGANDVKLATFKATAYGEAIKIETLRVSYEASDTNIGSLRNGKVFINGVQYGSSATLNEDGQGTPYTSYTVNYTVNPGTPVMIDVYADIYDNDGTDSITSGETIRVELAAGSSNASKQDSLGYINVPGAEITANTITMSSASATLVVNPTYANQTVAIPQTSGYKIGAWNMTGSSVDDILLTSLSFDVDEVTNATLNESDLTNLTVVVKDANGNTVANPSPKGTVSATDNDFSISYTLAKNSSVSIELYATIASGATALDSFKTDLTVTGTAMVSGSAISNADVDGQTIIAGVGTLTATRDSSSADARIVADNQTIDVGAFKFEALYSGFNVTDLNFTIADATNVSSVMLYDGATLVATKAGAGTLAFTGLNWNVPSNTSKVLTVRLQLGSVGVGAGTSGASVLTTLTSFTATSTATGVSDASANDAGPSIENNPASNATYVYAAIPTMASVALDSGVKLKNGDNVLSRFTITSNGGNIEWSRLFFEVTKSADPVLTNAVLWDVTSNSEVLGTDTLTTVGATNTAGTIEFDATTVQSVSGTRTYELRATASAVDIDVDSVVTRLAGDSAYAAQDSTADVETADADATIIWSDMSSAGHSTTTNDWTREFGIKTLPISHTLSS